jgi:hypothetical protein
MKLNESAKTFFENRKWVYFYPFWGMLNWFYSSCRFICRYTILCNGKNDPAMSSMGSSLNNNGCRLFTPRRSLFFPVYYLNKFASNAKMHVTNDSDKLSFISILKIALQSLLAS